MQEWYADSVYELLFVTHMAVCVPHAPPTTNPYVPCQQRIVVSCIWLSGQLGAIASGQAQVALKQHACMLLMRHGPSAGR